MARRPSLAANPEFRAWTWRWFIATLLIGPAAWAHFPFSYSAVETIGLVQAVLPPSPGVNVSIIDFSPKPEYDYLRLQPLVAGYTWRYRGTISNSRVTLPAELLVEVVSARSAGEGARLTVEYTVRHTWTLGTASAVTTISGVVDQLDDRILTTRTVPTAPGLPSLVRTFGDTGLRGMPRRVTEQSPGIRMSYARLSEVTSGVLVDGLGSQMGVEFGGVRNVTTDLGTFETLQVSQSLALGSLDGVAPGLASDGSVSGFPRFIRRPPDIRMTTAYALDVGPVQISWTQSEPQYEPIAGILRLVVTSFPSTPRPLRQPQLLANLEPRALEPGSTLVLSADVIGISPANRSEFIAPSSTPIADSAGTQYHWTTPRGERWTRAVNFYLESVTSEDAGRYQVEVSTAAGAVQTPPVTVMVTTPAPRSRLLNVASRAPTGQAADTTIAGIVLSPSAANASATRRLLFRAVGPALRAFGVGDAESDPSLVIYDSANREIARCDNWDSSRDVADRVTAATVALGTFPLPPGSRDAALALDLAPGAYTAHLLSAGAGAPSTGLVEIYDASTGNGDGPRIANLSTRSRIGLGDQILIPGIVVADGPARLLIRALGNTLKQYGITDALPDPEMVLYSGNVEIASVNDWAEGASAPTAFAVSRAAQLVGAAPLNGAQEAAFIVTVPPGGYTLHVRARNRLQTGVVVAEIFLLNP